MKRNWWKILCVLLLTVTFSAGFLVPLSPGIYTVSSSSTSTGSAPFTVKVTGYNTHFRENQPTLTAWLTNVGPKQFNTCADKIRVIDDTHLELSFPPVLPPFDPLFGLTVYNDADGRMFLENAVFTNDKEKATISRNCNPVVKNEKAGHFAFPMRPILYESMRNLFFHVPMWFAMIALLTWALFNNIRYLRTFNLRYDLVANQAVNAALLFGILGLITGSFWARATWGAWWVDDVKLNGTAITMLAYFAYVILRNAIEDEQKRATVSAIYSIFAYVMMLVLIGLLPRLQGTDSLHPGNGGNPAFNSYDLDNSMRPVFYSAVLGWILLGFWIYRLRVRIELLKEARLVLKKL
jgi:heme exporter protein C